MNPNDTTEKDDELTSYEDDNMDATVMDVDLNQFRKQEKGELQQGNLQKSKSVEPSKNQTKTKSSVLSAIKGLFKK